ncbi:MAG: glutamyl-tRNA reductase [Actinomycetota bacterium]|nr:glutamyl-tRNA reductase [Actinomycetota bacterium]
MSVVVVGLSHRTVPLDLLERLAVPRNRLAKALGDLGSRPFVSEAVLLSTCHRTEVYVVAERFHGAVQDVRHFLSETAFAPPEEFSDHLYSYNDETAAHHLFRVAAGLESVVVGESQILGQVRDAWEAAREEGTAGPRLSALFRHAIEVGKRARAETGIGRGIASLSQAAVFMAREQLGTLNDKRILVIGAGEIGERVVADLPTSHGAADVLIANRTWERAVALAARVGGRAVQLDALPGALAEADVVFTSSSGVEVVVEHEMLAPVAAVREGRPLLMVDLGMPRNIDPAVRLVPGVTLLDLSDVQSFVRVGLDQRRKEVGAVRTLVAEEVARYLDATTARRVAPTVGALHDRGEQLRTAELDRFRARLAGLDPRQREAVEALTRGLVAKLLHEPTVRLKDAAGSPRGERLAEALRELFDL